jgi:RimJ/RimL family protein N-acetyltransferase
LGAINESKTIALKDGRSVSHRTYVPSDRERLVSMYSGLSKESLQWSMPPYNRERIEWWTSNLENRIVLIAYDGERIVGHLQVSIGTSPRFREMGELIIYLHQEFQNLGLGTAMIERVLGLPAKGVCIESS